MIEKKLIETDVEKSKCNFEITILNICYSSQDIAAYFHLQLFLGTDF